jgi:hypothetical protein
MQTKGDRRDGGLKILCIMNSRELGKVAHAKYIFADGSEGSVSSLESGWF